MTTLKKFLLKNLFLLIIISLSLFFYLYNLKYTYFFSGDMARDTLASLRILKNKEITVIGPPLSFGQYGTREIYFSSLTYYMGALGLLLTQRSVFGPIYVNTFLMIIGIIFFYKLCLLYFKSNKKAFFATFLFSLSPPIVAHLRFFWNPNFLISISPIFWYFYYRCLTDKKYHRLNWFLTGIFAGILFLFHYFVLPVILLAYLILIKKHGIKKFIPTIFGLLISVSPLILFEIKNKFYLVNALIFNLTVNKNYTNSFKRILSRPLLFKFIDIFQIPVIFFGTQTEATHFPPIINLNYSQTIMLGGLIIFFIFLKIFRQKIKIQNWLLFILIFGALLSSFLAHEAYYLRYFFICLPLLAIFFAQILDVKFLLLLIPIFLITNTRILYSQKAQNDLIKSRGTAYPLIWHMEKIAQIIKTDNPTQPYNVTENFIGDARALYLRFFLERDDQIKKPENELDYANLKTLYVFAPNLKTIEKEGRWEFLATPNLKLTKSFFIDKNKYLFKFERN